MYLSSKELTLGLLHLIKVLHLKPTMSVEMASILSRAYTIGRLSADFLLKKVHWMVLPVIYIVASALTIIVLFSRPTLQASIVNAWSQAL